MSHAPLARGKTRAELIEGLPSKILLTLDWEATCELSATRRNCILHQALLHKDDITRPTVGTDAITFIWRGDARISVQPNAYALRALLQNDEAAAGLREWPTGQQQLYLPLDHIKVYDLRVARERAREQDTPEKRAERAARQRERVAANPEARAAAQRRSRANKQAQRTKAERGRFVLR